MDPVPGTAATTPAVPADSVKDASKPPVATAPQPGDSPAAESGKPPLSPEEQRLRDTQQWGHTKAQEAADAKRENAELVVEITGLREQLTGTLGNARFAPMAEPEEITFGDEKMEKLFEDYSKAEGDKQAFSLMGTKFLEMAEQRLENKRARETARQGNQERFKNLVTTVRQQITDTVNKQAPDVKDMELFWRFCAPMAEERCPNTLTNLIERWEWQAKESVKIYRERFGSHTPAPAPSDPNPEAIRRPAGAVVPGGSLQPRGGQPGGRPRNFAEQLGAMQERILPGRRPPQ